MAVYAAQAAHSVSWNDLKVQLARQPREQTNLSLRWIANRLHVGSWTYLSNLLGAPTKAPASCRNPLPLF